MSIGSLPKLDEAKVGMFRSRRVGDRQLITNEVGQYALLKPEQYRRFLAGRLKPREALHRELREKGFIRDYSDFEQLVEQWRARHAFLFSGPGLHIIVVTLRCDHKCVYCQTSSADMNASGLDMSEDTARRVVDAAFATPSPSLTLEFQGGEPLANWPAVRFIVDYALEKNKEKKKTLLLNLVTNLSLMDDEKLDFLLERGVNLCTSLDGPADVHDANRVFRGGASHANVVAWWRKIRKRTKGKTYGIDALMTTTRLSLANADRIVDEYARLGARGIYLRPLSPFGFARKTWESIGYGPEEFLDFYRRCLDRILRMNRAGRVFFEQTARLFAAKILKLEEPNFLDLRSPCGAGIGQLAYNYDGRVYTCDEGRMLSRMRDETFCLGRVESDGYAAFVGHPTVRALATASCLDAQAECAGCAYKPYCGVCPIENYLLEKDLFARTPLSRRCRVHKGILDTIFAKIQSPATAKILRSWTRVPSTLYQRD